MLRPTQLLPAYSLMVVSVDTLSTKHFEHLVPRLLVNHHFASYNESEVTKAPMERITPDVSYCPKEYEPVVRRARSRKGKQNDCGLTEAFSLRAPLGTKLAGAVFIVLRRILAVRPTKARKLVLHCLERD